MLDYEIESYEVEYLRIGGCGFTSTRYKTEEEAIEFIRSERAKWKSYKLIKISYAIIDF